MGYLNHVKIMKDVSIVEVKSSPPPRGVSWVTLMGLCKPPHDVHTKQSSYLSRAWDTGARPWSWTWDGAMRASGGRLNYKTRRPIGINPKKLLVITSKERADSSDGLANYPSRIEGVARRLNGKFDGKFYRNRERKLHIGTWNVTSLTGKEPELVNEAIRYRLDIVGVSSTKRQGNGTLALNKRRQLFYYGVDPALHAQAGVGILTNPRLAERVVEWRPISERVALLRLKLKEKTLALVQVYTPNTESEYAPFLDEVLGVLEGIPGTDSIVLLGDFNAHVGNDAQTWKGVIGKNGDSDINAQGRLLLDFCAGGGLSIMNTFFHHKDIHKYTWYRLEDSAIQKSLIDLFVVSGDLRKSVMDVWVKRGAELSTDHHLALCKLRLASSSRIQRIGRKRQNRIRWEALADEAVRHNFAENVDQRFS